MESEESLQLYSGLPNNKHGRLRSLCLWFYTTRRLQVLTGAHCHARRQKSASSHQYHPGPYGYALCHLGVVQIAVSVQCAGARADRTVAVDIGHSHSLTTGPCGRGHLALALLTIIKRDRYASKSPLRKFAPVFSQSKNNYGRQMWYQNDQESVKFNVAVIVC